MRVVTQMEILESREMRHEKQNLMIDRFKMTLVSFTLNIPGEVKASPEYRRVFETGMHEFLKRINRERMQLINKEIVIKDTGYEAYCIIDASALKVKSVTSDLEEEHKLGRIFDFDVINDQYETIRRADIGMKQRVCVICGDNTAVCRRLNRHFASQVEKVFKHSIDEFFNEEQKLLGQ